MVDQPALVDALPVLREELAIGTGLHCCVIFLAADKAFHQS